MTEALYDLHDWLISLPADFAFLLALPFVLAAAALLKDAALREREKRRQLLRDGAVSGGSRRGGVDRNAGATAHG